MQKYMPYPDDREVDAALAAKDAEIERLNRMLSESRDYAVKHASELRAEIDRLRNALGYYAKARTVHVWGKDGIYHECGQRIAKDALNFEPAAAVGQDSQK